MRIAIWYNLPSGGAKRSLYYQVKGLQEKGHHVELWRPPIQQEEYLRLADLAPEHEVPLEDWERDSRLYIGKLYLYAKRIDRMVRAIDDHSRRCAEEIAAGGFDVLYSNICMHFHAPFVGRYLTIPKSIYLHEPKRPLYEAMPVLPWVIDQDPERRGLGPRAWKRRGRDAVNLRTARVQITEELRNIRSFDQILVNSRFSRESVLRAYGLNAEVCYLGIDQGLFRNHLLPRERFLIGLGTLGPSKNVRLAIEALGRVPKEKRPKLVWVANMADEFYYPEMVDLAKRLEVDFEPKLYISDEELVDLLNRAWAMVYAPRLEPFGFAPLEANSCGTPVVGVAEGGVRETVEDGINGLVAEHDADDLAAKIRTILSDRALRDRLGSQAEAIVRSKWSLGAANDRLEQKLLRLVENKARECA